MQHIADVLYSALELQRAWVRPAAELATLTAKVLDGATFLPAAIVRANTALFNRLARPYPRPAFAIEHVTAHGGEVTVHEEVIATKAFCRLVRFRRETSDPARAAALATDPRVLVCAPLSGHHATLLRDTISTLLQAHDVYVTDWIDARDVPTAAGPFHLADYVGYLRDFIHQLGARDLHVVAVCQPTVPTLAAVALDAAAGAPTPRTLTMLGGPVDARRNPTAVNQLATDHPLAWFERNLIHRVPHGFAGRGRAVYPGFLQLSAFVQMNPMRHAQAYGAYWLDHVRGNTAAIDAHEKFYDDYNAVLDMDAAYYLDTVRTVFQDVALARGTWEIDGTLVRPAAITRTALFTIEGEHDDISGRGQTAAAHELCSGIPDRRREQHVAEGCGHYGIFSGHRWRESVYPRIHAFVRAHATDTHNGASA
jgi:poly(3-hydroxybutyrate) depolymerase